MPVVMIYYYYVIIDQYSVLGRRSTLVTDVGRIVDSFLPLFLHPPPPSLISPSSPGIGGSGSPHFLRHVIVIRVDGSFPRAARRGRQRDAGHLGGHGPPPQGEEEGHHCAAL